MDMYTGNRGRLHIALLSIAAAALLIGGCGASNQEEVKYAYQQEGGDSELSIERGDYSYDREIERDGDEYEREVHAENTDMELDDELERDGDESEREYEYESAQGEYEYESEIEGDHGEIEVSSTLPDSERARQPRDAQQQNTQSRQQLADPFTVVVVDLDPEIGEACALATPNTYFEFDSAQLTQQGRTKLDRLSECLTEGAAAGESIEIVGFADPRGTEDYNEDLGSERAAAVAEFLESQGVAPSRINTESQGERFSQGDPSWMWPYNRRVEIRIGS